MTTHFDSPQAAMSSPEQLQRWGGLGQGGEQECTQIHFLLQKGRVARELIMLSIPISHRRDIYEFRISAIRYFPRLNYCKTHLPLEGITTGCISFIFLSQIWSMKRCLFDIETYCKHFLKLNQQMNFFFNLKWKFLLCHSADQ